MATESATRKEKNKVKANVAEHLLYPLDARERREARLLSWFGGRKRDARDLTPGANYDVPPDERGGLRLNFSRMEKKFASRR